MDLCIKLIDKGYQIVFLPGVHIWHDKINLDRDVKVKYRSVVCNDLVFLYRRSPFIFLIPALFLKFFSHLRFSINYKRGILFSSAVKGMLRFLGLFFTLPRNPVRISTFRKYYDLNRKNGSHRARKTNWTTRQVMSSLQNKIEPFIFMIPYGLMSRVRVFAFKFLGMKISRRELV